MKAWSRTIRRRLVTGFLSCQAWLRGQPLTYVFILAHARSGSTLLNHLLLGHPQFLGCGESFTRHGSAADRQLLAIRALQEQRAYLRPIRYVVDQITDNHRVPEPAILDEADVKSLLLIREPAASLASMTRVAEQLGRAYTWDEAAKYYVDRVRWLERAGLGISNPEQFRFLTYEQLSQQPESTLASLRAFLHVNSGFSTSYPLQSFTGKRGDTSDRIKAGRILPPQTDELPAIPPELLAGCQAAYRACVQSLAKRSV